MLSGFFHKDPKPLLTDILDSFPFKNVSGNFTHSGDWFVSRWDVLILPWVRASLLCFLDFVQPLKAAGQLCAVELPVKDIRHVDDGPCLIIVEPSLEVLQGVGRQLREHVVRRGDTNPMSDAICEGGTVCGIFAKMVVVVLRNRRDGRPDAVGVDAAGSGVSKEFLDSLPVLLR